MVLFIRTLIDCITNESGHYTWSFGGNIIFGL